VEVGKLGLTLGDRPAQSDGLLTGVLSTLVIGGLVRCVLGAERLEARPKAICLGQQAAAVCLQLDGLVDQRRLVTLVG
jgi:hypothetical protein